MGHRKRLLFMGVIMLLLFATGLAACSDDEDKGGTKTFYDGGISIDLPGGWTTETDEISGGYGRIMLYSSKKIREAESIDELPDNAAFGALMISELYDFELEDGPEGALRSYLELESDLPEDADFQTLAINGHPATRHTSMEEQNGLEGYNYDVGILVDDQIRVYLLMVGFKGDQSSFDETFGKLAESLVIDVEKLMPQLEGK